MKKKTILSLLFSLIILSSILTVSAQSQLTVTLSTTQLSYNRGDTATITGQLLSQTQPTTGLVGISVIDSQENYAVIRTVPTGAISNPLGSIDAAYLSDLSANPQSSASPGNLAYFTLRVVNHDSVARDLLAVVSAYDNNGVPLSYGGVLIPQVAVGSGFTTTISVAIPSWAAAGPSYAYGELYTDWPNQGGYPLALEASIPYTLTGTNQGSNNPSTSSGSQGSYALSFTLGPRAQLGLDTVFVSSKVNGIVASNIAVFSINQLGDFNGDKALNFNDIIFFANNWIAYYNNQQWSQAIDFNQDNLVNFRDIITFANAWIFYYSAE
jgi:hypothetical protein